MIFDNYFNNSQLPGVPSPKLFPIEEWEEKVNHFVKWIHRTGKLSFSFSKKIKKHDNTLGYQDTFKKKLTFNNISFEIIFNNYSKIKKYSNSLLFKKKQKNEIN